MTESQYFNKFGHKCALAIDEPIDSVFRWTSIDPTSELTRLHFKSYWSIDNNRKFHIKHHRSTIHPLSFLKTLWEAVMIAIYTVCLVLAPIHFLEEFKMKRPTEINSKWSYIHIINVIDIVLRLSVMGSWDEMKAEVSWNYLISFNDAFN